MDTFEKIIGYDTIKNELLQICDMIKNRQIYEDLGAKLPQGILLYGDPGLGKTMMQNTHFKPFFRDSLILFVLKKLNKTYAQVTLSGTLFHTVFCVP